MSNAVCRISYNERSLVIQSSIRTEVCVLAIPTYVCVSDGRVARPPPPPPRRPRALLGRARARARDNRYDHEDPSITRVRAGKPKESSYRYATRDCSSTQVVLTTMLNTFFFFLVVVQYEYVLHL